MPENKRFPDQSAEQGEKRPTPHMVFADLLQEKNAPHGPLDSDLKSALYVCAATKHYTFEEAVSDRKMILLGMMLSAVGYHGDASNLTYEEIMQILQELLDSGALEYVGCGAGFVAPNFCIKSEGKVRGVLVPYDLSSSGSATQLRFSGEQGDYPLFSKFIVIPGDEVKVVINKFTGFAYVKEITNKRMMLICEASNHNNIFCREKGLDAFDLQLTNDGVAFTNGNLVVAEIVARKSSNTLLLRAREIIKTDGVLNNFIYKAVLDHNLPNSWPEAVNYQVKSVPASVAPEEMKGRVDLRQLPLVTIDGEDARDFDDAVYCHKEGDDKFHLYVAIADVSYYVRSGSAIDHEALNRCTSVYFPYYVIPMLPVELSNGICSLNPDVDRLCMVCDMVISNQGKIKQYGFYPAVMRSHARLTYTEVQHMLATGSAIKEEHQKCLPWIKDLYELYRALRQARDERGCFEFENTEVYFLFDQNWKICGIEPEVQDEAHQIIEECMIAANICAATFVKVNQYDSLYRIHQRPDSTRLEKLRAMLSRYGIDLHGGDAPTPLDFKKVSEQVEKLPEGVHQLIALQMLRSMMKACYSPDNVGHFGLALDNYSHFTSPIRRYPDLQIHRVIKFILEKQKKRGWGKIGSRFYEHSELTTLGLSCSDHEVAAADAEYDVSNSLKCEYVKNFLYEVLEGVVSTVDSFGVFVTLKNFYIDGRIARHDVLYVDLNQHTFVCTHGGQTYHEGDEISVRVAEVNSMARIIKLTPVYNKRRTDANFDLQDRVTRLKAKAVENPQPDNDAKDDFFLRLQDISLAQKAAGTDNITRPNLDYSLASDLDLSHKQSDGSMAVAFAKAQAQNQAQEQATAPAPELDAKAKSSKTSKAKTTKAKTKTATAVAAAPATATVPEVAATAAATKATKVTKATKEAKATKSSEATETEAAPENSVASKKSTKKTATKTKGKAKEVEPDSALVQSLAEAATNIDADLRGAKSPRKEKKAAQPVVAVEPETIEVEVAAAKSKTKKTKAKSNAKSVQDGDSLELSGDEQAVSVTAVAKPAKVTKAAKAKAEPETTAKPAAEAKPAKATKAIKAQAEPETPAKPATEAKPAKATKATKAKAEPEKTAEPVAEVKPAKATKAAKAKAESETTAKPAAETKPAKATKATKSQAEPEIPAKPAAEAKPAKATKATKAKAEPEIPAKPVAEAKPAKATKATKAKTESKTPVEPAAEAKAAKATKATKAKAEPAAEAKAAKATKATKATKAKAEPEIPAKPVAEAKTAKATKVAKAKAEPKTPVEPVAEAKPAKATKATKATSKKKGSE